MSQQDDEREALALIVNGWMESGIESSDPPTPADYELADLILTAGFHRTRTITEEMVERAAFALQDYYYPEAAGEAQRLGVKPAEGWTKQARAALTAALGDGAEGR